MKAKEFDEKIENEDFFDFNEYEEVDLNAILKESLKNKKIYFLIKQKADILGIKPEKTAEILLAEKLGLI